MTKHCPTCRRAAFKPLGPHIPSTPWTDECCCSDRAFCMFHRYSDDGFPVRPPPDVMEARAQAIYERELADWEALTKDWE